MAVEVEVHVPSVLARFIELWAFIWPLGFLLGMWLCWLCWVLRL